MTSPTINQTVVGDHNIFTATGNIQVVYELPPSESEDRRSLLVLLGRVEQFWIKEVFEGAVKPDALLRLEKKTLPDAIDHPWQMALGSGEQVGIEIPPDKDITVIFEAMGRLLLILGEPGSGKTITLLELTRSLIESAQTNPTKPVPVFFQLSSWGEKRQTLYDWLVEELRTKYYIPPRVGRSLLTKNRLVLFLDGLDEVSVAYQSACVEAINCFARDVGTPGLVVSCRLNDYRELHNSLAFNGAIQLQPLSDEQIDRNIKKRGEGHAALRMLLDHDKVLQDLAASPLMLDVMMKAYQDLPIETLRDERLSTINATRENVFQTYVTRMFERRSKNSQLFSREQTEFWISLLAKNMTHHAQSIFLIERLQPSWLSSRRQLFAYLVVSRTAAGLVFGLPLIVPYLLHNEPVLERLVGAICILVWTFIMGFFAAFLKIWQSRKGNKTIGIQPRHSRLRIFLHVLIHVVLGGLLGALLAGIMGGFWLARVLHTLNPGPESVGFAGQWYTMVNAMPDAPLGVKYSTFFLGTTISGMVAGWFYGLLFGLIIGTKDKKRALQDDIQTAETIGWSSERAKRSLKHVFFWVLIITCVAGSIVLDLALLNDLYLIMTVKVTFLDVIKIWGVSVGLSILFVVVITALLSFCFGTIGALLGGLTTSAGVELNDLSNRGIKSSLKKSIYAGIIAGIIFVIVDVLMKLIGAGFSRLSGATFGIQEVVASDLLWSSVIWLLAWGLLTALWYGGLDIIKHYSLRLILVLKGDAPKRFDSFLDHAVRLGFMRRVGGGYIFIHSLLRDYFQGRLITEK